jgi:imidazolonepropionase
VTTTAIINIGELITNDPSLGNGILGRRPDAALVIDEGKVAWVGTSALAPAADSVIDAAGASVIPGFVDSHAHPVFAGDRAEEFTARMAGQSYKAGGIRSTVQATREASDEELRGTIGRLATEFRSSGVTTFEAKSGYGLSVADEARSVRIAAEFTSEVTFLGAHVVPEEFADDPAGYVSLVCGSMLDACAPHSRWIDVFVDTGAFDADQARAICAAGIARGLHPRLHVNQLGPGPGAQLAVELDAASADHCTYLTDTDVDALANSTTVATLLPGAEFSTRSPYPNARALLDAGATVALATDCNPGSSYTTSMPLCIALAVREMHMTPDEALWSATAGGAAALRRQDIGHLGIGASADLVILRAPTHVHLAYRPGVNLIDRVLVAGGDVDGR